LWIFFSVYKKNLFLFVVNNNITKVHMTRRKKFQFKFTYYKIVEFKLK